VLLPSCKRLAFNQFCVVSSNIRVNWLIYILIGKYFNFQAGYEYLKYKYDHTLHKKYSKNSKQGITFSYLKD